jgi:hypothetical protein
MEEDKGQEQRYDAVVIKQYNISDLGCLISVALEKQGIIINGIGIYVSSPYQSLIYFRFPEAVDLTGENSGRSVIQFMSPLDKIYIQEQLIKEFKKYPWFISYLLSQASDGAHEIALKQYLDKF